MAVTFVTALNWKLNERRDERLGELAEAAQELGERPDGMDPAKLPDNPLFVDAVVSATRVVEHTHQKGKLTTLRNAVLNSALPGAPDADEMNRQVWDRTKPMSGRHSEVPLVLTYTAADLKGWYGA